MGSERRRHLRVQGPFDGRFEGRDVRIVDLSLGGCFLDVMSASPVGTPVVVEIRAFGYTAKLKGKVVYIDRVQGFAVMFTEENDAQELTSLNDILREKTGG